MLPPAFPFMIINKLKQIKIKFTNYFYPWQLIFSKQTCLIASSTLRLFHHAAPMRVPIFGLKNYYYNVCAAQQEGTPFASLTLEEGKISESGVPACIFTFLIPQQRDDFVLGCLWEASHNFSFWLSV